MAKTPQLIVDTSRYLTELMEEFSDQYDINSDPENCEPNQWLVSRIDQLEQAHQHAHIEIARAHREGYLPIMEFDQARKQFHEAFQKRVYDAVYKCNDAITRQMGLTEKTRTPLKPAAELLQNYSMRAGKVPPLAGSTVHFESPGTLNLSEGVVKKCRAKNQSTPDETPDTPGGRPGGAATLYF